MAEQDRQVHATLEFFISTYPAFFQGKPLALGTREQLLERHPDLDGRLVKYALLKHCKRPRYLKMLINHPQRYDLDGTARGVVTDEERQKAELALDKHHENEDAAEQRRLMEVQRQEEAARRKAERARIQEARAMRKQRKKAGPSASPRPRPASGGGGNARQPVIIVKKRHRYPERDPK